MGPLNETISVDTGTSDLLCRVRDRVAIVTLNRPQAKNALSAQLTPALRSLLAQIADDPTIGAMLLTGAGDAFCAGGDVKNMASQPIAGGDRSVSQRVAELQKGQRMLTGALVALRQPTIAALPGAAAGAGLAIALACDIRIAANSAFVATGYVRVGLSGDYGISALLTRTVGTARAREMLFTGRRMDAAECQSIGLFNHVVADAELQDVAFELARGMANGPATALRALKDNLEDALTLDFGTSLDREAERLVACAGTPDHQEAVNAFVQKRPAVFNRSASARTGG